MILLPSTTERKRLGTSWYPRPSKSSTNTKSMGSTWTMGSSGLRSSNWTRSSSTGEMLKAMCLLTPTLKYLKEKSSCPNKVQDSGHRLSQLSIPILSSSSSAKNYGKRTLNSFWFLRLWTFKIKRRGWSTWSGRAPSPVPSNCQKLWATPSESTWAALATFRRFPPKTWVIWRNGTTRWLEIFPKDRLLSTAQQVQFGLTCL